MYLIIFFSSTSGERYWFIFCEDSSRALFDFFLIVKNCIIVCIIIETIRICFTHLYFYLYYLYYLYSHLYYLKLFFSSTIESTIFLHLSLYHWNTLNQLLLSFFPSLSLYPTNISMKKRKNTNKLKENIDLIENIKNIFKK